MRIRKAKLSDAKRISYIIRRNVDGVKENKYTKKQSMAWKKANTPLMIEKKIKDKERDNFVIIEKDKILGFIALDKNWVVNFYVDYKARGKGIGSKLYDFIEKYAKKKGMKKLLLSSTPAALKFYKKRGYKSKGKYRYYVGKVIIPETKMEKKI